LGIDALRRFRSRDIVKGWPNFAAIANWHIHFDALHTSILQLICGFSGLWLSGFRVCHCRWWQIYADVRWSRERHRQRIIQNPSEFIFNGGCTSAINFKQKKSRQFAFIAGRNTRAYVVVMFVLNGRASAPSMWPACAKRRFCSMVLRCFR
jgi:hypothetical protein